MSEWAGYLLYRLASAVLGVLPERIMRRSGELLGWAASFVAIRRLRLVRRHLARVVGRDAATTRRARAMFASYGRYWAEIFWVRPRRTAAILAHTRVDNVERLLDAAASGKGIVLALPHMGNWEAAGVVADDLGVPVLAAAEALPNRRIVDWFRELRAQLGIEVVIPTGDRGATRALTRRLEEGGTVALVADRDIGNRGVPVELFGEVTTMPAGPAVLADRTGATLLPVGCYFNAGRGHRFVIEEPIVLPDLPEREARIASATQAFAAAVERIVRRAPEQWHLFQPNWPSDTDPG